MWMLTTIGFFSVVEDSEDADRLLVRARVREDLERLRDTHLPDLHIVENAGSDYRFRAYVERGQWVWAAMSMASEIDYSNFKNAVAQRQGLVRARIYSRVWHELYELQRRKRS